jgi:hypothetical protein
MLSAERTPSPTHHSVAARERNAELPLAGARGCYRAWSWVDGPSDGCGRLYDWVAKTLATNPRTRFVALALAVPAWLRSRIFAIRTAALNCSGERARSNMAIR